MQVRTRFAPSPTGFLHVGGLRTALYSYLLAKKHGGQFLLRIEDTDQGRLVAGATENIVQSLAWAGITVDEGVYLDTKGHLAQKGTVGSYIQSERLNLYQKHALALVDAGHAYYCFCTKERLDELRKVQEASKQPTRYDGHCMTIDSAEAKKRAAEETYVVRMKMPREGVTKFHDLIRGEVEFKNELIDDQVLLKSDGFPTYHLAVVVDDHLMNISHIIRGEEWVSSTPKHIQLYKLFGWDVPQFAHLSLLLNPDKSKLSKRQGDVAVEDYKNKGYLPEALVNFVAFLGWNPGTEKELFTLAELVEAFDLEKVNKSGAVFNLEKLDWYNQQYIRGLDSEKLVKISKPYLEALMNGANNQPSTRAQAEREPIANSDEWLSKVIGLEKERMKKLSDLPEAVKFVFELPEYDGELVVWKKSTKIETKTKIEELKDFLETLKEEKWNKVDLEEVTKKWIEEKGYGTGDVLWPMRTALSGQKNSPGPFEIADVLGKEETLKRLKIALKKLS